MPDQSRIFANPSAPDHAIALTVLDAVLSDTGLVQEAADVLVGLALRDDDRDFAEGCCVALGRRLAPGHPLLGLVGLCIGHLARRFGCVGDDAAALVVELAGRAQADSSDVGGQAIDGLDDTRLFSGRDL